MRRMGLYHYWCQKPGVLTFGSLSYWVQCILSKSFNLALCIWIGRWYLLPGEELKIESTSPFQLVGNAEKTLSALNLSYSCLPAWAHWHPAPSWVYRKQTLQQQKKPLSPLRLPPHIIQCHLFVLNEIKFKEQKMTGVCFVAIFPLDCSSLWNSSLRTPACRDTQDTNICRQSHMFFTQFHMYFHIFLCTWTDSIGILL